MNVSVCLPIYNCEKFIAATIESILNQTYSDYELIIVDNASTDDTVKVVKQFTDPRITLIENETNIGPPQNWNKAIRLAQGDIIALYHGDDLYDPRILEKEVAYITSQDNMGVVFTYSTIINEHSQPTGNKFILPGYIVNDNETYVISNIHTLSELLIIKGGCFLPCPSALINKQAVISSGLFDDSYKVGYDFDMWLKLVKNNYTIGILCEPLLLYRVSQYQETFRYENLRTEIGEFYTIIEKYYLNDNMSTIKPHLQKKYYTLKVKELYKMSTNALLINKFEIYKRHRRTAMLIFSKIQTMYKFKMFFRFTFLQFKYLLKHGKSQ